MGRVENMVKRLKNGAVSPLADDRDKHTNHHTKYSTEDINDAKAFIERLPRYKSHYCRKDSYVEECMTVNKMVLSSDKFRRIFTEEYNISFKSPKMDTCQLCDSLDVGHSILPSDRDFAEVEKTATSHYQMVYGSDHWQEVLKTSQWKNPFKPFPTMMICDAYSGSLELVALSKCGRPTSSFSFLNELKTKCAGPLPIKADKVRDIISTLKWIPAVYHDWYKSLRAASNSAVSQGNEEEEKESSV
ncbi:hypothetical protein PR048_029831 [Dryococelus australis]|uniref:Uncharacterized protein n=1 Tax=Dryococelus australis TaxID=614101 RepID=A0ABQ9G781_9NEOP|nr:hypothetical protein PR048_029831 [Dryococelus australis]